jgi:hypothetical protein
VPNNNSSWPKGWGFKILYITLFAALTCLVVPGVVFVVCACRVHNARTTSCTSPLELQLQLQPELLLNASDNQSNSNPTEIL